MSQVMISRSAGIPIAGSAYVAGGGLSGVTDALDSVVEQAAQLLADTYGMNVTVRFNSDRRSGGAWLLTHPVDRVGANAEIGLCASLTGDGEVTVYAHASERALNAPASGYAHAPQPNLQAAIAWLLEHAHVPEIPAHEAAGLTAFAYDLRERLSSIAGQRVRVRTRSRRFGYTSEYRGIADVTGHELRLPRTDIGRGRVDLIDLLDVESVEIMRDGRYRPFMAI